ILGTRICAGHARRGQRAARAASERTEAARRDARPAARQDPAAGAGLRLQLHLESGRAAKSGKLETETLIRLAATPFCAAVLVREKGSSDAMDTSRRCRGAASPWRLRRFLRRQRW